MQDDRACFEYVAWLLTENELQSMPMDKKKGIWSYGYVSIIMEMDCYFFRAYYKALRGPNKANQYATNRYYASFSFRFISYFASKKNIYLIHKVYVIQIDCSYFVLITWAIWSYFLFFLLDFQFYFSSCFLRKKDV